MNKHKREGFTLVETVIAVSLFALLAIALLEISIFVTRYLDKSTVKNTFDKYQQLKQYAGSRKVRRLVKGKIFHFKDSSIKRLNNTMVIILYKGTEYVVVSKKEGP